VPDTCAKKGVLAVFMTDRIPIKNQNHMTLNLSALPSGQSRAVAALISGERARTYPEAAKVAEMSLGTLYTHLRRVKRNHPEVYEKVIRVRKAQLAVRHHNALSNAKAHTRAWFRRVRKNERFFLSHH